MKKIFFILISLFFLNFTQIFSQENKKKTTRILFIFDASKSMWGEWESGKKISMAKKMFLEILDSLDKKPNMQLALRVYGHQSPVPPQDCEDSKLEIPFSDNNISEIKAKVKKIQPKGTTPIAYSLGQSANDFPRCDDCRNVIILITDGIEACEGNPCEVSLALQKKGIILKPFIIGIGLDAKFKKEFECVGQYYDADSENSFKEILDIVISEALNETTAQVNLLDIYKKPSETNVNMTFYEQKSKNILHNYIHTFNFRKIPDTLYNLNASTKYTLKVHTIPPVEKKDIKLIAGKHNIIKIDAPQGTLKIKAKRPNKYKKLNYIIRQAGKCKTLNVQLTNIQEKYLVGKYDLEILTLPRIYFKNVLIEQSKINTLKIEEPALVTFTMPAFGYGSLYVKKGNDLEWVCNLQKDRRIETLILQANKYKVVFRSKNSRQTIYTIEKDFKINSRQAININIK